ncbi:hypothetical protein [Futiania mangrovi]|uniref:Lipoprotein n=1 Tax=Futiania mangrovi TaxID=2959716 RepID=A0A9J6PNF3_9PROT|nr:hypothetical protein [Futiania mangrovii]MCP1337594.1 hypothetical protein [Futiania mangrovii]
MTFRMLIALGAASLLAACSGPSKEEEAATATLKACPKAVILGDASRYVRFSDPTSPARENVAVAAEMTYVRSACEHEQGAVRTALGVDVRAALGPAASGEVATMPFFVAVLGPDGRMLTKGVYEMQKGFDASGAIEFVEEVGTVTIPLAEGANPAAYTIYTGFQLDEAQVAYLRERFAN